jgi:hypothetical protein
MHAQLAKSAPGLNCMLLPCPPSGVLCPAEEWCAYRVEDWWTYEVCYKQHVRQYHKEQGKVVAEYVLGSYDEALSNLDDVQVPQA